MLSRIEPPHSALAAVVTPGGLSTKGDVTYSCGSCGYELNLSSCHRNTRKIDSKYGKAIRKGVITFFSIDHSKFSQKEEFSCRPHISRSSRGFFQHKTKLMCRKCGNHIGDAYNDDSVPGELQDLEYAHGKPCLRRKYNIKISSIQPSDDSVSLFLECKMDFDEQNLAGHR